MKIVVLDGYTLNPGDLDWSALKALGACTIHDRTPAGEVLERGADAEILLTNKTPLTAETFARLPALRYVGVLATGYNVVDAGAARAHGVAVTNVPAYGTPSVAQHVFALLLELTNSVGLHTASARAGEWSGSTDFCYWKEPLVELEGLTLGLVGFGRIGARVAEIGRAFGMKILATARTPKTVPGVTFTDLETLLRSSDAVSLHCPLTPETNQLLNRERIGWLKPSAFLINTGRGPLIAEADLAEALNAGRIAGAGLDVLSTEPPRADNPLLSARHCVMTPHVAWATRAARQRLMQTVVENVRAFLAGTPRNVVN
ncbi:MAG: D-2-hydroxyacid dehydrogenase [Chthoniobacteraceae bacterium]|nr:D-2-hydroxyacid dehydrogenase [Chthoniobacteraceae bacterium]